LKRFVFEIKNSLAFCFVSPDYYYSQKLLAHRHCKFWQIHISARYVCYKLP
jgi:hypothetical protein